MVDVARAWNAQADFMASRNAVAAAWDSEGNLISLTLAAPPARPAAPQQPLGPAQRMQEAAARMMEQRRREHETRFASSHFRPRLEETQAKPDDVPRAVRARGASDGRPSKNKRR